jgi:hypothetical protein
VSGVVVKKVSSVGALITTLANVLDKVTISNEGRHLH